MEYFFAFGRNPVLSRAELLCYLEARDIEFEEVIFDKGFFILDVDSEFEFDIQDFGGIVKLGRVLFKGAFEEYQKFLEREDLICKEKFSYSVLGNLSEELFIEKFKLEKRKAIIRRQSKGELSEESFLISKADVDFFSYKSGNQVFFGIVDQAYSYAGVRKRDMQKPVRRQSLAISPRLAKILINLSGAKEGDLLLDPFCGIGGILQEALVKNINVLGVDKDKDAIEGAKKNLRWLKENFNINAKYQLISLDSARIKNINPDAIAAEPSLGALLKKRPDDVKANAIIQKFEKEIIPVLKNLKKIKKPNARIAITFPFIRNFNVNFKNIERQTDLKIYKSERLSFPIKESRQDQFVSREIVVLV